MMKRAVQYKRSTHRGIAFVCVGLLVFFALLFSPLRSYLDSAIYKVSTASAVGNHGDEGAAEPLPSESRTPEDANQETVGPEMDDLLLLRTSTMQYDEASDRGASAIRIRELEKVDGGANVEGSPMHDTGNGVQAGFEYAGDEGVAGEEEAAGDEEDDGTDPGERWRKTFSPVPECKPVDQSFFSDALFIGDSRVMGLMLYSGLTEATFYTEKGLNVNTLLTKAIVLRTGGSKITVPEALKQRQFGKIYIKTGINELGWRNIDMFIQAYAEVIDKLRELQPDAVLYVQSILPASQKKAQGDPLFSVQRISEFNQKIQKMTWEKDVHYLDVFQYMANSEGYLPEEAASDGIHLKKEYCEKWLDYLQRHVVGGEALPRVTGRFTGGEHNE